MYIHKSYTLNYIHTLCVDPCTFPCAAMYTTWSCTPVYNCILSLCTSICACIACSILYTCVLVYTHANRSCMQSSLKSYLYASIDVCTVHIQLYMNVHACMNTKYTHHVYHRAHTYTHALCYCIVCCIIYTSKIQSILYD